MRPPAHEAPRRRRRRQPAFPRMMTSQPALPPGLPTAHEGRAAGLPFSCPLEFLRILLGHHHPPPEDRGLRMSARILANPRGYPPVLFSHPPLTNLLREKVADKTTVISAVLSPPPYLAVHSTM